MAVDPTGRFVYTMAATHAKKIDRWEIGEDNLAVIDLTQRKIVRSELSPKDKKPNSFGMSFRVSPDGKSLYLFGESVLIFSTDTLKLEKDINMRKPIYPGMSRVNFVPEIDPNGFGDGALSNRRSVCAQKNLRAGEIQSEHPDLRFRPHWHNSSRQE